MLNKEYSVDASMPMSISSSQSAGTTTTDDTMSAQYQLMSMVLFDGQRRQTELLSVPYNVIEIVLLAVMVIECLAKLTCALRLSHKKVFILFKSYSYVQLGGSPSL